MQVTRAISTVETHTGGQPFRIVTSGLPRQIDLEAAVRRADIVSCATLAMAPLIEAEWLCEVSHLDLVGSFTPEMTETQPERFANAGVWVDTLEAVHKSSDVLNAIASGHLRIEAVQGHLTRLCRRECVGRQSSRQRTVFKAVGSALEDLAAAKMVFRSER